MTEQLITEIQRKMLPYLNNEQLMHLRDAMAETLEGATITYDSGSVPAEETLRHNLRADGRAGKLLP